MNELQNTRRFLEQFSGLRVVWMYRSVDDVVNSCVRRWSSMREVLLRISRDPSSAGWFGEAIPEHSLEVVRRYASESMSLESAYALFWFIRNSFYFDLGLDAEPAVRLFRYERLVREPAEGFRRMFGFCGCPFEPDFTKEVFSTSVGRHQPPDLAPPIRELCTELAKRFDTLDTDSELGLNHALELQ